MKRILDEFKTFAMRGNVVDLAVGVVIGAAFGKIVTSLVNDIVMPVLALLVAGVNFSELVFVLKEKGELGDAVIIRYGNFLQSMLDFFIISLAIFLAIKVMNRLRITQKKEEVAQPSEEVQLLTEIRDELKTKGN